MPNNLGKVVESFSSNNNDDDENDNKTYFRDYLWLQLGQNGSTYTNLVGVEQPPFGAMPKTNKKLDNSKLGSTQQQKIC